MTGQGERPLADRRWLAVSLALLAGVVIGVVVKDARNDALQRSRVDLVAGSAEVRLSGGDRPLPEALVVSLLNTGPQAVDVVRVDVDGFRSPRDAEPPDAVTVPPDEWVTFRTPVAVDCATAPASDVQVHAQALDGDQAVDLDLPPDDNRLASAWQAACEGTGGTGVHIGAARATSRTPASVTMMVPLTNNGAEPVRVISFDSGMPGFAATSVGLPLELPAGGFAPARLAWTVADCAAAVAATEASIAFTAAVGEREIRVSSPLGNAALIELVRLSVRACES